MVGVSIIERFLMGARDHSPQVEACNQLKGKKKYRVWKAPFIPTI